MNEAAADRDRHAGASARDGDTVLFLHGTASSGRMWRAAAQALAPHRAVAPDLIG